MSTSKDQQTVCPGCGKDFATSDRSNFCCNTISETNEMGIAITTKDCAGALPMSTNKAHPHAVCCIDSKLYRQVLADAKEAMHYVQTHADEFGAIAGDDKLKIIFDDFMKDRKPAEPTLLQGHTMEQWGLVRKEGFLCEFSVWSDFRLRSIDTLSIYTPENREPFCDSEGDVWPYCRPLRTKGVKQPWFGEGSPAISLNSKVVVFYRNQAIKLLEADKSFLDSKEVWKHRGDFMDIIAFIEL